MINQPLPQSRNPWKGGRLTLSTRGRFVLLIMLFNMLLLTIIIFSIRNQEIITKTLHVETVNIQIQTRLAVIKSQATRIVYVTATFTPLPIAVHPSPTPSPTFTETPIPPTDTPTPLPTPTNTLRPTSTFTPTSPPTPTASGTPTATSSLTPTPTTTNSPSPTATHTPTATNSPTSTSTATFTPTPTDTHTPTALPPPSIAGIAPDNGGNESVIAATLSGSDFQAGATVILRRAGYSDIAASDVTVVSANQITCQFDLAGATPGLWDVIVTNPDSQSGMRAAGFTVNPELEHFDFDNIGHQTINISFPVTITAHDRYNNIVTDFTGAAALSDSTGTVTPAVTGNFVAGVWTGNLTIAQVQTDDTITAVSSGRSGVSNNFTIAHPEPLVISITPNTALNTVTTPVTITGSSFANPPTARLDVVALQNLTFINDTTLTATVPDGMAAGVYDLYVTNPGPLNPTGVLSNAFTVQNADIPSTTLETSFLTTYGISSTAGINGDNDSVQVIFLEVPNTLTDTLYVRIFDPELGAGGFPADIDELCRPPTCPSATWDTSTTFSLYGGGSAYSALEARQAAFATPSDTGISTGTLIISQTFAVSATLDDTWYLFATINPTQGELVGNKRVFKLSVVGGSGDDGNLYNVALSTSATSNIAPQGARIFAYSWTFLMPNTTPLQLYPFVASTTSTFTQHNFDMDNTTSITIITPINIHTVTAISGEGTEAFSSYPVTSNEQLVTWAARFIDSGEGNDGTAWFTDQNGYALPIFARSTTEPAPPP